MSLRPPGTPRASISPSTHAGSTPSALPTRRRQVSSTLSTGGRSSSSLGQTTEELESLRDAMRQNDPGRYESPQFGAGGGGGDDSPSPVKPSSSSNGLDLRKRVMRQPSGLNLRGSLARSTNMRPSTPTSSSSASTSTIDDFKVPRTPKTSSIYSRPRTPTTNPLARSQTPTTPFGSTASRFTAPRREVALEIGDEVWLEVTGVRMEGIVRFLGAVEGKDGMWGGVELDLEWQGRGKNDGTVKGTQYFACPPLSGLFVPLSKLNRKRSVSVVSTSAEFSAASVANLTAGSGASKYLGVTAQELTKKRLAAERAALNASVGTSGGARASLRESVGGSMLTPRATKPRMSIGPGVSTTTSMRTPRKSIGGAVTATSRATGGFTPRASLGASMNGRLPPTSRTTSSNSHTPDVPPLPSDFDGRRSITPAHRMSTTGAGTMSRRMSTALGDSTNQSLPSAYLPIRPTTPSVRSVSRQSFLSTSTTHSRHSQFGTDDGGAAAALVLATAAEDVRLANEETRAAGEREMQVRKVLEASERLGREMEEKMDRKVEALSLAAGRIEVLEREVERERRREEERVAGLGGEEGDKAEEALRVRALEERVLNAEKTEEVTRLKAEKVKREMDLKLTAREGELASMRERMDAAKHDAEAQETDLLQQLESLREAGQSLCAMYEARLTKVDSDRIEAIELAETLTTRLEEAAAFDQHLSSPHLSSTLSASTTSATAVEMINAENAQADLEHMRGRILKLEDQLEEARSQLEVEVNESIRGKQKRVESEAASKKEIKQLKETIDRLSTAEALFASRMGEMELAFVESETALENERSEVERLRLDATSSPSATMVDELRLGQKQIVSLKTERSAAVKELEGIKRERDENRDQIDQLRQQVSAAEKEIDRHHRERAGSLESDRSPSTIATTDRHRQELELRDAEIMTLRARLKQQPTSPRTMPTNQDTPNSSTFSSPTNESTRNSSTSSNTIYERRSLGGKDELSAMKEQITGLKVIIATLGEENQSAERRNKILSTEAQELKDAQRALEATVENLMLEMPQGPSLNLAERRSSSTLMSNVPLQREVDELKVRLREVEKHSAKEIKSLIQEVSELESLVESKIFREDELETQLRRYQSLTERAPPPPLPAKSIEQTSNDDRCEMCDSVGHDISVCPAFGSPSKKPSSSSSSGVSSSRSYCDDCEEYGHSLQDCPLVNEMF